MAYIRKALVQQGYDAATVKDALSSWEPGTTRNYESYWARWRAYADGAGQDPAARNVATLVNWLNDFRRSSSKPQEGTIDKAKLAVTTTWDFIDNGAELMGDAIKRLTKKTNGAKSTGLKEVWDLAYLHEYVDGEDISKMKLSELADSVILKTRGLTGWRSADMAGIYPAFSFDWTYDQNDNSKITALRIRTYDTKSKKGQWSAYTTVPVLAEKYKHLCAVRAILELLQRREQLPLGDDEINNPDGPGKVKAKPFLVCKKPGGYYSYKEQTISSKFRDSSSFLENVKMVRGDKDFQLSAVYKSHSCRNAVASTLNDMSVKTNTIAAHMNTTVQNLEGTYITKVVRDWDLPLGCASKHTEPAAKLLLPYVHYISMKAANDGRCDCANLLGSIPK